MKWGGILWLDGGRGGVVRRPAGGLMETDADQRLPPTATATPKA